ncbi:hypothetical protein [Arthrobacter globiformis]|uniref:hypothetical protein n=1 Tax=Arthrobacter globiformis TaxID=1665 RepID=UPI00278EAF39|nr:hypothetical protein [Arthrobacter globiformis]MDQ0616751.1 hypothetical protein [Arthrobacter globiformis]
MNKNRQIQHDGLLVSPMPTKHGTTVYAEVVPAAPLIVFGGRGLQMGRSWKQLLTRWWFEIHETAAVRDNFDTHLYMYDGGTTTLRQAIRKAGGAVDEARDEIETAK